MTGGYIFSLSTLLGGGGSQVQVGEGGSQVQGKVGGSRSRWGVPSLRSGGYPVSGLGGTQSQVWGGVPGLMSMGGYPVSVKGKIFDTRFGLIHVQTGKKFFVKGPPPPPPPVKGKNFDTRFGLIHVQTGKKILSRDPPPLE